MQSFTFASDEAMAAVLAAFDAASDDTYDVTMQYWGSDFRALATALTTVVATDPNGQHASTARELLCGLAEGLGWSPAGALILTADPNVRAVLREMGARAQGAPGVYCGAWNRAQFEAVTFALRLLWESTPDVNGSVPDNAGSLLSGIAETLGVEFV